MNEITIHLNGLDADLAPTAASKKRDWWETDPGTKHHAVHCLPLTMANSVGHYLLSPGTFRIRWSGRWDDDVEVDGGNEVVDNHSAHGSFTVQPGFIPSTKEPGDFLWIKGIANQRGSWFNVMEAMIEAWWQPAPFGLVCLMSRPGSFVVNRGEPIAQMVLYKAAAAASLLSVTTSLPAETAAWYARRTRSGYHKDLDYLKGLHPDGRAEPTHMLGWRRGAIEGSER